MQTKQFSFGPYTFLMNLAPLILIQQVTIMKQLTFTIYGPSILMKLNFHLVCTHKEVLFLNHSHVWQQREGGSTSDTTI